MAAANKKSPIAPNSDDNLVELLNSSIEHDKLFSDLLSSLPSEINMNINNDLLGLNQTNTSDNAWMSAFDNTSNQQVPVSGPSNGAKTFLPSTLLNELLTSPNKTTQPMVPSSTKPKSTKEKSTDKSNWFNLFAELDPLQNPDAIGKTTGDEFDRNC